MITVVGGTETSEGFIPYKKLYGIPYSLPVALDFSKPAINSLYPPLRLHNKLVYALPGGKFFTP